MEGPDSITARPGCRTSAHGAFSGRAHTDRGAGGRQVVAAPVDTSPVDGDGVKGANGRVAVTRRFASTRGSGHRRGRGGRGDDLADGKFRR
jgi:hypothetical protein